MTLYDRSKNYRHDSRAGSRLGVSGQVNYVSCLAGLLSSPSRSPKENSLRKEKARHAQFYEDHRKEHGKEFAGSFRL